MNIVSCIGDSLFMISDPGDPGHSMQGIITHRVLLAQQGRELFFQCWHFPLCALEANQLTIFCGVEEGGGEKGGGQR